MTDRDAALRRLAGMLGPEVYARMSADRAWMSAILAELRFLEDIGFAAWAFPGADGWQVIYQRREVQIAFESATEAHRVTGTLLLPIAAGTAEGGWSLGPALALGQSIGRNGSGDAGSGAIDRAVATWRATLERTAVLFDDTLDTTQRVDIAESRLARAEAPPVRPRLSGQESQAHPWWWRRYRVEVTHTDGTTSTRTMVTNQGPVKALSWTLEVAQRRVAKSRPASLRQATITDEGPIEADADGVAVLPDDADHDRMEF